MKIRRSLLLLVLALTAVIAIFFIFKPNTKADFGPAVGLCPGPDLYGYVCESGTGFSYIDATTDIVLYEDDGIDVVALPFPFVFYGTTYTEISISSNGNLQFGSQNGAYANDCISEGPIPAMGDMIAPFWDDLDARLAGTIDIDTVGTAPNRIFIVEWDQVPYFGNELTETVTFEVQLFEETNDILFLYEDVSLLNSNNGRSATVGLQSANQGLSLQYSCNQAALSDAVRLAIRHPEQANSDIGQEVVISPEKQALSLLSKGTLPDLAAQLNAQGPSALTQWQQRWLNGRSPIMGQWEWVDLTGNGRSDLILLLNQPASLSEQSALVVFQADSAGNLTPVIYHPLSTRETAVSASELLQLVDLTQDKQTDALLRTPDDGRYYLLSHQSGALQLHPIPDQCTGSWIVQSNEENGRLLLVRDQCNIAGRTAYQWVNDSFQAIPAP